MWWRKQYRENRYMSGLTNAELDLRFADIFTNSTILTEEGKIGIGDIEWMEKFTHLLEEFAYRGLGMPPNDSIQRRLAIPEPSASTLGAKVRIDYPKGIPESFTLFKYGNSKFLQSLIEDGAVRLLPASRYDDPSLNTAIEDKELEFVKIVGHKRFRYSSTRDFYCFCSSWIHSDRLVGDFGADAVLVIRDPHEFFIRLATALDEKDFDIYFNRVAYIDPLLLGTDEHVRDIALAKHMRFTYQFEHRWIAMPRTPIELKERKLVLGPLADIAELYTF